MGRVGYNTFGFSNEKGAPPLGSGLGICPPPLRCYLGRGPPLWAKYLGQRHAVEEGRAEGVITQKSIGGGREFPKKDSGKPYLKKKRNYQNIWSTLKIHFSLPKEKLYTKKSTDEGDNLVNFYQHTIFWSEAIFYFSKFANYICYPTNMNANLCVETGDK